MSGGIPDIAGLGYLPLRHEDERVDIGLRNIVNAVALKKIDPLDPNLVTEVPGSAGDLLCASFWTIDKAKRNCPGWAFAWPVKVTTPAKGNAVGLTSARGDDGQRVRPILDATIKADERFEEKQTGAPAWASKPPKGWTGIVTAGTQENKQELVFHPDALGLVASDAAGDPDLSTIVMDLDAEGRPDEKRLAHLNAAWRVIKEPKTVPSIGAENGLAWQHGSGKGGRGGYGLITGAGVAPQAGGSKPVDAEGDGRISTPGGAGPVDSLGNPVNDPAYVPGLTIGTVSGGVDSDTTQSALAASGSGHACMSVFAGGPIAIPAAGDQHQLGSDADGNPIFAAHMHTSAIFLGPDKGQDGPIAFERGGFPKLQPGNFLTPVHLRFDPATPHTWSAAQRSGAGMWRLFAETLLYVPEPPTTTPPTTPPETTPPPVTTPPPTTPPRKKKRRIPPPPPPTAPPPSTTPRPPEKPEGGGVIPPPSDTGNTTGPGGRVETPGGGGDRPENPPPRPPGKPDGSIDRDTGLPPPPPKDGPPGAFPEGDNSRDDATTPFPRNPNDPIETGIPTDGRIDPAEELDGDETEYDPDRDPERNFGRTTQERDRKYVAMVNELAVPGILIRPGSFGCGKADLRNNLRPTEAEVRDHDRNAPICGRIEGAWVKSGSACGSSEPSYTYKGGRARYLCGTASGILALLPPEVGMEDAATDFAPGGVTRSSVVFSALKGVTSFGSGIPDPTTALVRSGWKWGARTSDDKFALVSTTAAGADDKTVVVPNITGTIPVAPSIADNKFPRWNGTAGALQDSGLTDDDTTISIGRATLYGSHSGGLTVTGSKTVTVKAAVGYSTEIRHSDDTARIQISDANGHLIITTPPNTEALSGDKTILSTDARTHYLNPGASNRDVTLSGASPTAGRNHRIKNTGSSGTDLVVKDHGGSTIVTLSDAEWADVEYDGANWQWVGLA